MDYWSDVLSRITPVLHYSIPPISVLAAAWQTVPSAYGWLGLCGGYALVMLFTPVRRALAKGRIAGTLCSFWCPIRDSLHKTRHACVWLMASLTGTSALRP